MRKTPQTKTFDQEISRLKTWEERQAYIDQFSRTFQAAVFQSLETRGGRTQDRDPRNQTPRRR